MKKLLALLLAAATLAGAVSLAEEAAPGAWYEAAVQDMLDRGVMNGTDEGFAPDGLVTRATLFQALYNLEGRPESAEDTENSGLDEAAAGISGHWWTDAARWAYAAGLTNGTGEGFAGDRTATRAELVTILYRYAQGAGVDVSVGERTNILGYEDAENVPAWAVPAFQWAVGSQTVSGRNGTLLAPADSATRAELAQILSNYLTATTVVLTGKAVSIDKFGIVRTDITQADLSAAGCAPGDVLRVTLDGERVLSAPWVTDLDAVDQGRPLVLVRDGAAELAISRGDFATDYGVGSRGDSAVYDLAETAVTLALERKGRRDEAWNVLAPALERSDDRADYSSDEVFANFRAVEAGDIAPGALYRSSNPIDTSTGRNACADRLLAESGVKTIVNMADCRAKAPEYEGFAGTCYETVHEGGGVVYLNMGADIYAQVGLDDLRNGLEFMTEREGPYLIHSTWGKDRTGHLVFLLEALMGASEEEIVADYMRSYEDLYHIEPGSEAWELLARGGIRQDLDRLLEVDDAADLQQAAERYLVEAVGLTREQVETLKENLSR